MEKINDGGPAFPGQELSQQHANEELHRGMSLRDYFATHAMNAELASSSFGEAAEQLAEASVQAGVSIEDHMADNAYNLADAMLRRRDR